MTRAHSADDGPVLVTGGAGFVGTHLLDLIARQDRQPVAWHRPGGGVPTTGPHAPPIWQAVDLLDRRAVAEAIDRVRPARIYHCAGAASVGGSWARNAETLRTNVLGTHHLFEALRLAGCPARLLVPGSALVYRPSDAALAEDHPIGPRNPYAFSKLAQERLALEAGDEGLEVILPRAFNHLGPGQHRAFAAASFAEQIARIEAGDADPVILTGNLEGRRDFTDVRDTVKAYHALMDAGRPGRVYNVCSGRAHALLDVLQSLCALSRVDVEIRQDPARLRPHDQPLLLGDPTRIRTEIGWQPAIPLERTLADILDAARARVGAGR